MKKKVISYLLCGTMTAAMLLGGCSSDKESDKKNNDKKTSRRRIRTRLQKNQILKKNQMQRIMKHIWTGSRINLMQPLMMRKRMRLVHI